MKFAKKQDGGLYGNKSASAFKFISDMSTISHIPWRWDQGRLSYFAFDNIRLIARALCGLENISLHGNSDPIKSPLARATGLPFRAGPNVTWRNYARVFQSCLLATEVGGKLICSELAHKVSISGPGELASDEYFGHFIRRFYYPAPAFIGYINHGAQLFPGCALLRFLLSRLAEGEEPKASVSEILSFLIANQCRGDEDLSFYQVLTPSSRTFSADEERQVRELVIFLSQLNILKWDNPYVFLDVDAVPGVIDEVLGLATPFKKPRKAKPERELLQLGETGDIGIVPLPITPLDLSDIFIREGGRKSVTHVRTERSSRLRSFLFSSIEPPFRCDICNAQTSLSYPWTSNLLEVHHLLPLSSPVRVNTRRTSLQDLVPLCPNCHKATHSFYTKWLKTEKRDDFDSHTQAKSIYSLVKTNYRPN